MMSPSTDYPTALRLQALGGTMHGFLGRQGGVSTGIYDSLNVGLGSNDDPAAIAENRERALASLWGSAGPLVTLHQVHSADVVTVTAPFADDSRPRADGMVTDVPGLALGILTADCTPVLLADHAMGVVGACHAGWKGALGGVAENTVEAMVALGARREWITAGIGPVIQRKSYEVDDGFVERFVAVDPAYERFFTGGRAGHHHFDLPAFVAVRLYRAGVKIVETVDRDTYSEPEAFFSYRRTTHRGEPDYGRQIAIIARHIPGPLPPVD